MEASMAMQAALLGALAMSLVVAAATDLRSRRIPNAVCAAMLSLYPFIWLTSFAPAPWWGGLAVGLALFAAGTLLFALGALGGGDVKLAAVTGLWAGPGLVLEMLLVMGVAGGVVAALCLLRPRLVLMGAVPVSADRPVTLPYGVAIAAGGLWAVYRLAGL